MEVLPRSKLAFKCLDFAAIVNDSMVGGGLISFSTDVLNQKGIVFKSWECEIPRP